MTYDNINWSPSISLPTHHWMQQCVVFTVDVRSLLPLRVSSGFSPDSHFRQFIVSIATSSKTDTNYQYISCLVEKITFLHETYSYQYWTTKPD